MPAKKIELVCGCKMVLHEVKSGDGDAERGYNFEKIVCSKHAEWEQKTLMGQNANPGFRPHIGGGWDVPNGIIKKDKPPG